MKLIKDLYLTDRIFYFLGAVIFLFFISFLFAPVFYIALASLFCCILILSIDVFLLFKNTLIEANRTAAPVFSLSDKNKVSITIINLSKYNLKVKIVDEIPYQFNERDFSISISLKESGTELITYHVAPVIRGEYFFGNIHTFVKTKIGLAAKKETTKCEKSIAVYPSIIQLSRQELIALNHPLFTQGENKNKKIGRSYEFDQIKIYVPGDDTRNINWKATSTQNEIMVNHYEDERSQQIYSIIDKSRVMKMPFNGLTLVDYAINSTLAFSNIVLKKQDKAGLISFSKKIDTSLKADRGARHLKKIMYALYKEKYDFSEANYEALYTNIRRTISNRSLLFLYTNFESIYALERNISILRMINRYHLLVVVFFENTELEAYSKTTSKAVIDIYQQTIAKKFILEKNQIVKELNKHGIQAIKCTPENLSANTINKYLELKSRGVI
jgi:uncharacterized protein (DUF58 family)